METGLDADHVGCSTAIFFEEVVDGWEGGGEERSGEGERAPLNGTLTIFYSHMGPKENRHSYKRLWLSYYGHHLFQLQ